MLFNILLSKIHPVQLGTLYSEQLKKCVFGGWTPPLTKQTLKEIKSLISSMGIQFQNRKHTQTHFFFYRRG